MSEKIKQIAKRIKELRKITGFSVEGVASALKIAPELYRKYENGSLDIPVSFLYAISRKLKVELTVLLTGDEPRLNAYCLVKKGTGPFADRRKDYKYRDLAYNFIHKKAEVFLVNVEPESKQAPAHFNSHPGQEFNYLLEGEMKVILDGREIILERGDSLFFNSGLKHAMVALKRKPAKFLAIIL